MKNLESGDVMNSGIKTDREPVLSDSYGGTVEKNIPDDVVWYDDAFYIKETRFGLFTSILKNPLGQHFLTGATKDGVIEMSRWHLKCAQDGSLQDYTRVVNLVLLVVSCDP